MKVHKRKKYKRESRKACQRFVEQQSSIRWTRVTDTEMTPWGILILVGKHER